MLFACENYRKCDVARECRFKHPKKYDDGGWRGFNIRLKMIVKGTDSGKIFCEGPNRKFDAQHVIVVNRKILDDKLFEI